MPKSWYSNNFESVDMCSFEITTMDEIFLNMNGRDSILLEDFSFKNTPSNIELNYINLPPKINKVYNGSKYVHFSVIGYDNTQQHAMIIASVLRSSKSSISVCYLLQKQEDSSWTIRSKKYGDIT
ncbi:MAG: hypothetical protein HKN09_06990 [Saprospiraceae bacterium]|nr:hypothetical protein [Saprospiraceae bacterium]